MPIFRCSVYLGPSDHLMAAYVALKRRGPVESDMTAVRRAVVFLHRAPVYAVGYHTADFIKRPSTMQGFGG